MALHHWGFQYDVDTKVVDARGYNPTTVYYHINKLINATRWDKTQASVCQSLIRFTRMQATADVQGLAAAIEAQFGGPGVFKKLHLQKRGANHVVR